MIFGPRRAVFETPKIAVSLGFPCAHERFEGPKMASKTAFVPLKIGFSTTPKAKTLQKIGRNEGQKPENGVFRWFLDLEGENENSS